MFLYKNKLDPNLSYYLKKNSYKNYRVLIKCKNFQNNIEKKITSYRGQVLYSLKISKIICAIMNNSSIAKLIEYPEVSYVCFDEYLFLCGISVSTANNLPRSYNSKLTGKNIYIGIVDSGVYPHPDLLNPHNNLYSFIDLINDYHYPYDDNGHGTAICGIISGSGISSNYMFKGIAPDSKLICYKAFDSLGKGYVSDIAFATESLISDAKIKILCLPFELLTHNYFITEIFNAIFNEAIKNNIIPILPSGSNLNLDGSIMGLSSLENCITVGGIDYPYSSCGPINKILKPNLCAACTNITSLNTNTSFISEKNGIKLYPNKLSSLYKSYTGTSLSVAFVSGICALLYENNMDLSFYDILSILKLSCDSNNLNKNKHGEGIINFSKLMT